MVNFVRGGCFLNDNKFSLAINMVFGTIGTILIVVGIMMMIEIDHPIRYGHLIAIFGFSLVMTYIYYLEGKSGISTKHRWIRLITTMIGIIVLYFIFQTIY